MIRRTSRRVCRILSETVAKPSSLLARCSLKPVLDGPESSLLKSGRARTYGVQADPFLFTAQIVLQTGNIQYERPYPYGSFGNYSDVAGINAHACGEYRDYGHERAQYSYVCVCEYVLSGHFHHAHACGDYHYEYVYDRAQL